MEYAFYIGGSGQGEVHYGVAVGIVVGGALFAHPGIGTNANGVKGFFGVGRPFAQRLPEQGDGGHQEKHQALAAGFSFGDFEGGKGFARSAGHDELAALGGLEVGMSRFYRLDLMGPGRFLRSAGGRAEEALFELAPVHRRLFQVVQADAGDGRMLAADGGFGIGAPMVGGGNPKAVGKSGRPELLIFERLARGGEEGIHRPFVHDGTFLEAFALDGPIVAGSSKGYEVNAGVLAAKIAACGEFIPKPYVGEQLGIVGVGLQIGLHEALEFVAFVAFGKGVFPEGV